MAKQKGRGWYVHGFAWDCHNCECSVCTGRLCPYQHFNGPYKHRCAPCTRGDFKNRLCIDCDFFENKYTVPRHFKIVKRRRRESPLEKKFDAIMEKLGVELDEEGKA